MKKHIGLIESGINLDHIPQGNALYIMKILKLHDTKYQTGVGLNLPSKKLGFKDLIKIEGLVLSEDTLKTISPFCVGATYSVIDAFKVVKKIIITLPPYIENTISCPNGRCISHDHSSRFVTSVNRHGQIEVVCYYCGQVFLLKTIVNNGM